MTAQVNTSGSQTATISTEHTLATVTDPRVLQLNVELTNLANGSTQDILEIRRYVKVRSGDTERLQKTWSFSGGQTELVFEDPPRISPHHTKYTLKQIQGTGRAFNWAVVEPGQ